MTIKSRSVPSAARSSLTALAMTAALLAASAASATIISGSVTSGPPGSVFVKLGIPFTPPAGPANTVGNDTFQNNNLYGFDEDQNIVLAAPLTVDVVPSGPLTLAIGTTVASHYIFFDPRNGQAIDGLVNFDSNVVAIITSTARLAASDFLANTGVTYLNPGNRGLEAGDSVTISGPRQIRFDTTASTPGDYVRVLTAFSPAAVPEPGTMAMIGAGLLGLMAARRRKA